MAKDPIIHSEQDWWVLVERKRHVALRMVEDRQHCREAWSASGSAVEFALKAAIMRRARFNSWPSKEMRPDLWVHDLRQLFDTLGIPPSSIPQEMRGKLKTVLDWDRLHDYNAGRMPRRQAKSMMDAAFAADGVIEWLKQL